MTLGMGDPQQPFGGTRDAGRVRPHASLDFTAQDGSDVAAAYDALHSAALDLLTYFDSVSDRLVEAGAQYANGPWRMIRTARRARAELLLLRSMP